MPKNGAGETGHPRQSAVDNDMLCPVLVRQGTHGAHRVLHTDMTNSKSIMCDVNELDNKCQDNINNNKSVKNGHREGLLVCVCVRACVRAHVVCVRRACVRACVGVKSGIQQKCCF